MKTLFASLLLFFYPFISLAGPVIPDVAIEGYPGEDHIVNGRYKYYATSTDGHTQYRADRTEAGFLSPLVMSWNSLTRRWEINVTKIVAGTLTTATLATSIYAGNNPPVKGWSVLYPYGNPLGLYTSLKLYETVTQYSLCDGCRWGNPATWSSGFLPRAYDNVVINSDVVLDVEASCNNLTISSVATFPFDGHNLTGSSVARLKLNGNLDVGVSGRIDIHSMEFLGNVPQTLKSNAERGTYIRMNYAIINNPKGIRLLSAFGFFSSATGGICETRFVKGKVYLGDYMVSCQSITGDGPGRYFVTNGQGYLALPQNNPGTIYNKYFPIGSSDNSYTPLRMTQTSTGGIAQLMARVERNDALFPATPHVNAIFRTRTMIPTTGTLYPIWIHQVYWDATDESAGFNHAAAVRMDKLTDGTWTRTTSSSTPSGTGPYNFSHIAVTRDDAFAVFQTSTGSTRIAAEDVSPDVEKTLNPIAYGTYPNPASATGFKVKVDDADQALMKMVSMSGMNVHFMSEKESENTVSLHPTDVLYPGIYLLQVQEKNMVRTHKVIIK